MKKILILTLIVMTMGTICLTGCNDKGDNSDVVSTVATSEVTEITESVTESVVEETSSSSNVYVEDVKYDTLKEYFKSDEMKTAKKAVKKLGSKAYGVDMYCEGNACVYSYVYKEKYSPAVVEELKTSMESYFDGMTSTFENASSELQNHVNEDIVVKVKLSNGNGDVIFEKDYAPKV